MKSKSVKLKVSETEIVRGVLDLLALMKIKAVHHRNSGNMNYKSDGSRFFGKTRNDQKGIPDILFTYRGYGVAFECKTSIGRMSDEQKAWAKDFITFPNNGIHFIIRSIANAESALNILKGITRTI